MNNKFQFKDLGLIAYAEALQIQKQLFNAKLSNKKFFIN